jgi:DNA-binding beta-propeller fold protein YncE
VELFEGLNYPYGVALDSSGNIYIADTFENVILKLSSTGELTSFNTISPSLYRPSGVALDSSGNIYVTDFINNRIVVFLSVVQHPPHLLLLLLLLASL